MELKTTDISHLLKLVSAYDVKRKEIERIQEESGHNYNIFNTLQLASSEVRLHSSIIASLLCHDKHGAKDAFLKEFLRIPKIAGTFQNQSLGFDCSQAMVEVEKYIGPLTETTGGRIDIYLSDGNNSIIVENKIYANDQKNQLLRYHNFNEKSILLYLTLDGSKQVKILWGTSVRIALFACHIRMILFHGCQDVCSLQQIFHISGKQLISTLTL